MQPLRETALSIPAFLGKLWKMVNDPSTDHLICWSQAGNSFVIQNQAQFWYDLLPLYYKHNNMSSFVRQLNMYGFHKIAMVDNGALDADKDEIQFYHPYFQKDQPELLKLIKRKVTAAKTESLGQGVVKPDDLAKVLTDIKMLKGRQTNVDNQLSAMKQENAVLWRELALLRQKHIKQQQIVNKLIQFLMSLVQPSSTPRMGVKRRMPLMLPEGKGPKERKTSGSSTTASGPIIHEVEEELVPELLLEDETGNINSPSTPGSSSTKSKNTNSPTSNNILDEKSDDAFLWDKPELISGDSIEELNIPENDIPEEGALQQNETVFLNPSSRNTLLTNLVNGNYNPSMLSTMQKNVDGNKAEKYENQTDPLVSSPGMAVATREKRIMSGDQNITRCRDDLDLHLDHTQSELDQFKDILNSCNSFDANALLSLFNDETPNYSLSSQSQKTEESKQSFLALNTSKEGILGENAGYEVTPYGSTLIDFNELFDDSIDGQDNALESLTNNVQSDTINTPLVQKPEPIFPTSSAKNGTSKI